MSGPTDAFRVQGKRALVTGAGRGLGRAIAETLAEAGADVTLVARSRDEIATVAGDLRERGLQAGTLVADVTDVGAFAASLDTLCPFDVFVNNAGTNRPGPLLEVTEADYDAVMSLNVRAAVFAAQAVARGMIRVGKGGSIINMSSQMGHVGAAKRTIYCASKWALEGFTKALAVELGQHRIRVNTICPTFIDTPLTRPFFKDESFRNDVLGRIKLGRLGTTEEVAQGALYLASDASSLMTGSALMLDGGWTAD
ncbi:SDR family NAD(P)-dependent oxidoreductase [Puniceibacterium sediminis]|uniref:NAD(P)-dependent dehydrogenase, short-chain alcohol dehydrogenase family n=1 Tax=Puniceibacterium sediminis TaxID=1608407 RepID=A0A238X3K8_9RHOB|nr:SDR family NAD(P)-dependent oxidoreductase [Puniceibacterium sediminis]SNR53576.1 NAD(P)-dependent dehydrogenase, short-chain alcohol dehydrogenase family [Puniceibacterium sediminis]